MPFEHPLAAEGNPESLRNVESFHAPTDRIAPNIQAQLSNPHDIASANQFFQPTGGEQFLPSVGKVTSSGIEMSGITPSGKFAAPPMTGLETHGLHLPAGGEMAALPGAHGVVMPGAEQISPLINMIMKMPGHIGLASSFFEALGAFFAPAQEMLGHLVEGLDVGALFEHAGAASEALGHVLESAGEHMSVDLNLLPADAPIFDQIGHPGTLDFAPPGHGVSGQQLMMGAPHLSDSFASAPHLEVGGSPSHPVFEAGPDARGLNFDGPNRNLLAMDPNGGFGSTVGNFSPPAASATQALPQATPPAAGPHHGTSALDFRKEALSSSRHHLLGDTTNGASHGAAGHGHSDNGAGHAHGAHSTDGHAHVANRPEAHLAEQHGASEGDRVAEVQNDGKTGTQSYTVHKGDNLWDIAHNHLGSGSRWEEIYDLNKSVLGDNPRMIMPGTELQLPGGDAIASGSGGPVGGLDYTVHSGDNLWNISHDHLSGGQSWHELYQNNEAVIGSNPAMIHPGQHLHLDGSAHGQSIASAGDGTAHATGHAGAHHDLHAGAGHHHGAGHPHTQAHNQTVAQAGAAHQPTPETSADSQSMENLAQSAYQTHGGAAGAAGAAHHNGLSSMASHHQVPAVGGLNAQAQSLSSTQAYGDASGHTIDAATQVPNQKP